MPTKDADRFATILNKYFQLRGCNAAWLAGQLTTDHKDAGRSKMDAGTVRRWRNGETTPLRSESTHRLICL